MILAAVLGLYLGLLPAVGENAARAAAYVGLAVGNLSLALAIGASAGVGLFDARRRLFWTIAATLAVVLLPALYAPGVFELFRFEPPPPGALTLAVGCGLAAGGWSGVVRALRRRRGSGSLRNIP